MKQKNRQFVKSNGFTLIEVVMASLFLSILLVGALNMIGASRMGSQTMQDHSVGVQLAAELMNEILEHPYVDPTLPNEGIGLNSGERSDTRRDFDDIDDYNKWVGKPPVNYKGKAYDGYSSYTRSVSVEWVNMNMKVSASDTGLKLITVSVDRGSLNVAKLQMLRSVHDLKPAVDQHALSETKPYRASNVVNGWTTR